MTFPPRRGKNIPAQARPCEAVASIAVALGYCDFIGSKALNGLHNPANSMCRPCRATVSLDLRTPGRRFAAYAAASPWADILLPLSGRKKYAVSAE